MNLDQVFQEVTNGAARPFSPQTLSSQSEPTVEQTEREGHKRGHSSTSDGIQSKELPNDSIVSPPAHSRNGEGKLFKDQKDTTMVV